VLGPVFDACSTVSSRQRLSPFGFAGEREKYASSTMLSQRPEIQEKVHQYRAQNLDSPPSYSSKNSWPRSIQNVLPLHLGRHKPTSDSNPSYNTSTVGHPITPVGWTITLPPQAVTPIRQTSRDPGEHCRSESLSPIGLRFSPHQTRSPVLSQLLPTPPNSPSEDELYADPWLVQ